MARSISSWLAAPFRFTPVPVTVLTVAVYAAIFALVLTADKVSKVPKKMRGLNLDQAYEDLHRITTRPHPYISHANDDVRLYLLSRLEPNASKYAHVHLSDDLISNASYIAPGNYVQPYRGVYFEGTNILVKIDGTDSSLSSSDGVLFSAHYDSVSTAPGATDDGMGVVTLLSLVDYLSAPERRPRRTAIFFFNNGEEDGLHGAYAFWKHPWSNLTSSFINLEGAASGGQPLVFRSTSLAPMRSFLSHEISHPHAEVTSADAYTSGVVRSYTDYEVFERGLRGKVPGMQGIDFAFYKNRAYYHTPMDSIPGMGYREARKSLWAMMEGTRGAGLSLLNDDNTRGEDEKGVYFDLFKYKLVLFSLNSLYVTNIVFLAMGPVVILALLGWVIVASNKASSSQTEGSNMTREGWAKAKKFLTAVMGWGRFWLALAVGIIAQVGLVIGFVKINPYVVHSRPHLVLLACMTLSYLAIVLPLQILQTLLPSAPVSQKLAVSLELYFLTWIFLLVSTIAIQKRHIGGVYWVTAWNISAWIVCGISLVEGAVRELKDPETGKKAGLDLTVEDEQEEASNRRFVRGVLYEAPEPQDTDGAEASEEHGEVVDTEPTEITPLMHQHRRRSSSGREYVTVNGVVDQAALEAKYEEFGWWILQLLVSVPLTALLLFQVVLLLLHALSNTMVDGSSPWTVYEGLAACSLLIFVPIIPFAHRLHSWLTITVAVIFALSLTISWTAFPFTQERPFKVYFQQSIELEPPSTALARVYASSAIGPFPRAVTVLTGLPGFVNERVIPELPSSWGKDLSCSEDPVVRPNLLTCRWEGALLANPGGPSSSSSSSPATEDWLDLAVTRVNASAARVSLGGRNTRACRLYFDRPIAHFAVRGAADGGALLPGYAMPPEGVRELRLWSRTWDRVFEVELWWEEAEDGYGEAPFEGRAACEWAEYASGAAGGVAGAGGRIPALEEVKMFLPVWALPTKTADGLVEAWTKFSV
ncbi:Vacuolar membrane protease [Sparassis crispa]|uniref:Peptide hydrolase n=1 Tax=Sparassis crispa TaxID=139825 RepID=A0A401GJV9_9APHY|nr:Vacuolar membrane protease [Sparassis crispa]GBE82458.1 Vacuolar membrane protease [Sparassis crispa]